jgi:aerotolerance regulator-like protein
VFTFLNPFGLWLGAALAVPLMIHFLGRQRLRKQPFPSLLLVRERFSKSMHRHRLKNLLLLILRTLLILCLLLALSNPALETRKASVRPDVSVALIHNGIYGSLMPEGAQAPGTQGRAGYSGDRARAPSGALDAQWRRIRGLDSAQGIATLAVPAITDGPGAKEVSQRFGDYGEAVRRALAALGAPPGTAQLLLPVFDWSEAASARGDLERALKESPGLQLLLIDYGGAAAGLNAFTGLKVRPSPDSPTLKVVARLSPAAAETGGKAQVILNGRPFQEVTAEGGRAEVTLPLGEGPHLTGRFTLPGGGFAAPDLHFCFPDAEIWTLAHAGSVMASLPSLGRESYFRRIIHVAASKDIWNAPASRGPKGGLRVVYLAAERGSRPDTYARAVEFVKSGGKLILGVGRESDIPGLNRFLLQPLRMGRLGNLLDVPAGVPVLADRSALSRLGRLPADPGTLGAVRKRFAFAPDSGAEILLSQGNPPEAVLAARDFHRGQVLLWTTDIDDLEWSDIGVSPLVPLLHQAFQEAGSGGGSSNRSVASDSLFAFAADPGNGGAGTGSPGASAGPVVIDPEGRAFTKVRADGARLRIGPFDKLGIHLIVTGGDTSAFAVNLAQREAFSGQAFSGQASSASSGGSAAAMAAGSGAAADTASDADGNRWKEANDEARSVFLGAFKPYHGRVIALSPDEPAAVQASMRKLWPALLLAALLLLFLEGLISATFSIRKNGP